MRFSRTPLLRLLGAFALLSLPLLAPAALGKPAASAKTAASSPAPPRASYWSKVASATLELLESQHYLRPKLDAQFSRRALERYFETLDPSRLYFRSTDLEEFRQSFGESFASSLKAGRTAAVDSIHGRYQKRVLECNALARECLNEDPDFSKRWEVELSREKAAWPKDEEDARRIWREQISSELLAAKLEGLSMERARRNVQRRLDHTLELAAVSAPKDKLAPALLAAARACDAHSDYLTQEEMEETENDLRLTRVGIGVTLDGDILGLRVASLLPGGPAQRDGRLRVNDRIVAVAEDEGEFREVEGLPFSQALVLLRGKKGSLVKLKVAPARGSDPSQRLVIGIRRDEMHSGDGESYAKIIETRGPNGTQRWGWLVVPGFYGDDLVPIEKRASSVSRDVATLLRRMKAEKVNGVVLDLRSNLGGLLDEAIQMGGLFCGPAPIALARTPEEGTEVLSPVKIRRPLYEGPLVVLTDHSSASASELLAGALQDYGRAIVVGGEQTFGKGSVQTTLPLGEYLGAKDRKSAGGLALTIGKFYRVSGQSTQIAGVRPDIVLPSTLDTPQEGEAALVDPLPHDAVDPAVRFQRRMVPLHTIYRVRSLSEERVAASREFQVIASERDRLRMEQLKNKLSLQESARRAALESAGKLQTERERWMQETRTEGRFYRLLLSDSKLRKLTPSDTDPLASADPESTAVERETLEILKDLAARSGS